jgi:hypothetical protein
MSNKITVHNVETGEIFERDLTEQEIAQSAIDKAETERLLAEREAKATAKAALLTQLGITEEQAKLLLS